ncbi:hypothetical protein AB0869_15340 [Micromonospora vinacea]|uniref:hypothetical protein n=1 Tax=Micromonospora vinacea TaxID=709878 RepID=UPI0034523D4F
MTTENISQNPTGFSSDIWYEIVLHDGRSGYLSDVYIAPQNRGGLSLPECPPR